MILRQLQLLSGINGGVLTKGERVIKLGIEDPLT